MVIVATLVNLPFHRDNLQSIMRSSSSRNSPAQWSTLLDASEADNAPLPPRSQQTSAATDTEQQVQLDPSRTSLWVAGAPHPSAAAMLEMISLGEQLAPPLHHKALRPQFHHKQSSHFTCVRTCSRIRGTPKAQGASLEGERQAGPTVELSQDEMKLEEYIGKVFLRNEINDGRVRHIAIRYMVNAMGVEFNWTLNQEI